MSVYKSGAFLQQCFSVHPLSLDLKLVALPETIGVVCTNCRMRHRLTIHQGNAPPTEETDCENKQLHLLQRCFQGHPQDIRISSVMVENQTVEFKCRPCRCAYLMNVSLFETHQS